VDEREDEREQTLIATLQATLDHEIPLSRAIGIAVLRYDAAGLALGAPIAANTNHKSTAFAGSLNAVATLAGWGLVWLLLRERDLAATIVIQESEARYHLPVRGDFTAICPPPPVAEIDQLTEGLRRKGKARLKLAVEIHDGLRAAVTFTGRYVAIRDA
jgi:thioesterase domain-containing protein